MNELMIFIKGGQYIKFTTKEKMIMNALYAFENTCKDNGLNIKNLIYESFYLKDKNCNPIEEMDCV